MSTLTVTPEISDADVLRFIREHLASGEHVQVTATEPFMSPQQMAQSMNVSRSFIMNKIAAGQIVSFKHGARHRIPFAEIERFRRWYARDIVEFSANDAMDDLFGDAQ